MARKKTSIACAVLTLAVLSGALSLAVGYLAPSSLSHGSIAAADVPLDLTPQASLPFVAHSPLPEPPPLTIYDLDGVEQDWDWLTDTFGAVTLERGTGAANVTVLRAVEGPVALCIRVLDSAGDPVENVPVVVHWPDAPDLQPWQQACGLDRGLPITTDSNGYAEFAMGPGAYYFPPNGGPHTVWLAVEGTDCLGGLGMLGGTNHIHLDSVWTLTQADMAIAKTDDPDPVVAGNTLTYTLVVNNHGPDDDDGVTVIDALPAGVTFESYDASQGTFNNATGQWSAGYLPAGESATLTLLITVNAGTTGTLLNSANVSGNEIDPEPGNNSASTNTWVTTEGNRSLYLPLVLRNYHTWDPYYEENDHWLAAYGPLASSQAYQAYPDDEDDYYYFQLLSTATANIRVEAFAPTSTHGDLLLYGPVTGDDRGPLIAQFGQPGHSSMVLDPQILGPGKYYVRVYVANSNYYSTNHLYILTISY